ncbi:uncharacterized protein LOC122340943 isoform X3 [Puntigrus tetrazona]|uniref:uncharacterized protein LOC122340943 isoform X3 n=1 Tax=Puntigrus tetrazona TaxID=1606681 RepID=UPI001C8A0D36|nr:uncharacterized protein LOC122340943 isoform X3 [Puntigrus tetrazona]
MDARLEEPVHGSKEKKKRHIQRVRSPLRYTHRFRPRFEGKHLHSRFRFFRTMEERRFIRRPNFALRYQRHHTYQRPRACPRPGSTHTEDRTDISRPSPGNRSSLSSTNEEPTHITSGPIQSFFISESPLSPRHVLSFRRLRWSCSDLLCLPRLRLSHAALLRLPRLPRLHWSRLAFLSLLSLCFSRRTLLYPLLQNLSRHFGP